MKNKTWLKLIGLALLSMIVLILISFIEVAIYSYLINPGHDESFYEAHAEKSAPYVSAIGGFILFFLVARYWTKKNYENAARLAILFPLVYIIIDIVILLLAAFDRFPEFLPVFLVANSAKFLGSYLGYRTSVK